MIYIFYGVLIFLIGLSLGWLLSQYILRRRLIDTVKKYQVLREVLREKNGRIKMQQKKIADRDVVIGNLRSLIRNHERVISELKNLVQDRLELLRILGKSQAKLDKRWRVIESDRPQTNEPGKTNQPNDLTKNIEFDPYLQYGSGNINNYEDVQEDEDHKVED